MPPENTSAQGCRVIVGRSTDNTTREYTAHSEGHVLHVERENSVHKPDDIGQRFAVSDSKLNKIKKKQYILH